jgi:hypothetical protein
VSHDSDRLIAELPKTPTCPNDSQRPEAIQEPERRDAEAPSTATGDGELALLCRDFVLNPSTVENLAGDRDSLFSSPEPEIGDHWAYESALAAASEDEDHEQGEPPDFCRSPRPLMLNSCRRRGNIMSPSAESQIPRDFSATHIGRCIHLSASTEDELSTSIESSGGAGDIGSTRGRLWPIPILPCTNTRSETKL